MVFLVKLLVILAVVCGGVGVRADDSDHRCEKVVPIYKWVTTSTWENVPVQKVVKCARYLDRLRKKVCYEYQTEYKEVVSEALQLVNQKVQACCQGYAEVLDVCVPQCENCWHGSCVAPGECSCNEGYAMDQYHGCMPVCDDCENGYCVQPNVCDCHAGYEKNAHDKCVPKCTNCLFGECIGIEHCQCLEGYAMLMGVCRPVCGPACPMGSFCAKPNQCECHEGYEFENNSTTTCVPKCNVCLNGKCVKPNICECLPGYEDKHSAVTYYSHKKCDPVCEAACVNGECTAPNFCTCDRGYRFTANSTTECEPICEPPCQNGTCTAPNECSCAADYKLAEGNKCVPICDMECVLGECVAPQTCACLPGYSTGTIHDPHECVPICDNPCTSGYCDKPNECVCYDGFRHSDDDNSTCVPACETVNCTNGECVLPELCVCNRGFREVADNFTSSCAPVCSSECTSHGTCISPNYCDCEDGYTHPENGTDHCVPKCDPECGEGECIEPNLCLCEHGYYLNDAGNCSKHCESECVNSDCRNGECECWTGFKPHATIKDLCLPHCEQECRYGTCMGNNTCICDVGYENAGYTCVPKHCADDCGFGVCISAVANLCDCFLGYEYERNLTSGKLTCMPMCFDVELHSHGCANGTCIAPDVCECFEGFELSAVNNYTCILLTHGKDELVDEENSFMIPGIILLVVIICVVSILGMMFVIHRMRSAGVDGSVQHLSIQGMSFNSEDSQHF